MKECVDRASFCNQLLTALKNHNSLAVTIAEVFATLGREGDHTKYTYNIYLVLLSQRKYSM